jgi:hypothetical protein
MQDVRFSGAGLVIRDPCRFPSTSRPCRQPSVTGSRRGFRCTSTRSLSESTIRDAVDALSRQVLRRAGADAALRLTSSLCRHSPGKPWHRHDRVVRQFGDG